MEKFFNRINKTTLVLTANRSLASYWKQRYLVWQQNQNGRSNFELDILPLQSWLEQIWSDLDDGRQHCNQYQEKTLIEQLIKDNFKSNTLIKYGAVATLIQQAWHLMQQWQLSPDQLSAQSSSDVLTFSTIAKDLEKILKEKQLVSGNNLTNEYLLINNRLKKSKKTTILLLGFDVLPPLISGLINDLKQSVTVESIENTLINKSYSKIALPHQKQEITAMALWAQKILAKNPAAKIGCVVPNLSNLQNQITQVFTDIFTAAHQQLEWNLDSAFSIAVSKPLLSYPIIYTAFAGLALLSDTTTLNTISHFLRAPFFTGAQQEFNSRAILDKYLHQQGEFELPIKTIVAMARQNLNNQAMHCPVLAENLQKFWDSSRSFTQTQTPSNWANFFSQQLTILGWPGERELDTLEQQLMQGWQRMLMEYAKLDKILPELDYQSALHHLKDLAENINFAAPSKNTPIQILDIFEASGMQFDGLWIMGLDDQTWPPPLDPNPFIPFKLQRQLKMPRANANHELELYRDLTRKFSQSAEQVIFSYPLQKDDQPLLPSTLLANIPSVTLQDLYINESIPFVNSLPHCQPLEKLTDYQAPAVHAQEKISGGSGIFAYQAKCPFSAFAKFRLGAHGIDFPEPGLNSQQRGIVLHAALDHIWQTLGSQEKLLQHSEAALNTLINTSIEKALLNLIAKKPYTLQLKFREIEQQRLQPLLLEWLTLEKLRSPFKVIAQETSQIKTIGGVRVQLRIDRIDQLASGEYVIIDYKTGLTQINHWFGTRPTEPQLPLYCCSSDLPIAGIAFAQVRVNHLRFNGVAMTTDLLPGILGIDQLNLENVPNHWQELLQQWQTSLNQLGQDFSNGKANVDPKDAQQTCRFCDLKTLCRVYELNTHSRRCEHSEAIQAKI